MLYYVIYDYYENDDDYIRNQWFFEHLNRLTRLRLKMTALETKLPKLISLFYMIVF